MTLFDIPNWVEYTLVGFLIMYFMYACGMILARIGKSPAWCLLLFIPFVQIIVLWIFAFMKWPAFEKEEKKNAKK